MRSSTDFYEFVKIRNTNSPIGSINHWSDDAFLKLFSSNFLIRLNLYTLAFVLQTTSKNLHIMIMISWITSSNSLAKFYSFFIIIKIQSITVMILVIKTIVNGIMILFFSNRLIDLFNNFLFASTVILAVWIIICGVVKEIKPLFIYHYFLLRNHRIYRFKD